MAITLTIPYATAEPEVEYQYTNVSSEDWDSLPTIYNLTDGNVASVNAPVYEHPEAFHIQVPAGTTDVAELVAGGTASGNVLTNDVADWEVTAVNGLNSNVGIAVEGSTGGMFTVNSDGSWTFDSGTDFDEISANTETSVEYLCVSSEAFSSIQISITVTPANAAPVAVDDAGATTADATTSGNVLTNDTDADLDALTVSQVAGSASSVGVAVAGSNGGLFTIGSDGTWTFDPDGDFDTLTGEQTATTSVSYHVSDGADEDEGTLTVTVGAAATSAEWTPAEITTALWLDAADSATITLNGSTVSEWRDKSGNSRHAGQVTASLQPTLSPDVLNGHPVVTFSSDFMTLPTDALRTVLGGATKVLDLCVYRVTATNSQGQRVYQHEGTTTGDAGYFAKLVGVSNYVITTDVIDGAWQPVAHVAGSNWHLDSAEYIGGTALRAYDFGALTSSDTSIGSVISTPAAGAASVIGATGHANVKRYFLGQIAERVLVVGSVTDRQKIEGYLAHKWGLSASLPSDHPYKSAAPTDADPYWASVVLLVQPEDGAANGSTTIIDRSLSARTLTRYGNTQVSTALGDPTVLFDGSGDYITAAHDSVFNFNSTCTLEFIITPTTTSKLQALLTKLVTGNYSSGFQFIIRTDGSLGFNFYYGTGLYYQLNSAAGSIVAGNTYHIALTRSADYVTRLHLNGVYVGQVTQTSTRPPANTSALAVAREPGNTARDFQGHMRIRWTNGVARYGANDNFTPPTKFQTE